MKKQLLTLIILCISLTINAQTFVVNNITYTVTSTSPNKVSVSDYNTTGGLNVVIPSSVTPNTSSKSTTSQISSNATTYSVTSIKNYAFQNKLIESVTIPATVTQIGISSFKGNKLRSVTIPSSVTEIKASAFRSNPMLTCVTSLNTTPPTINSSSSTGSFEDRYKINLVVPSGALTAYNTGGWSSFNNNGSPLEVNDTFWDGFLKYKITSLTNNKVAVIEYNTDGGTSPIIPETVSDCTNNFTVVEIGTNAFIGDNITNVSIPNTVTSIKKNGFASCNLTSLNLPNSIVSIGEGAFSNNDIAGTLIIPDGVTSIGNYAFRANSFNTLILPNSLTTVGSTTFATLMNLERIFSYATTPPTIVTGGGSNNDTFGSTRSSIHLYIPTGTEGAYVTNSGALWTGFNPVSEFFIDNYITYEVTSTSPNTVKTIDYNTDGGTTVTIPNTVTNASVGYAVKRIEDLSFYGNSLTSVTIADGIETIGEKAFKNNSIQTITIPNSVIDVEGFAFENNQLITLNLSNSLTEIKSHVFQNNMLTSLTIPNSVTTIQKNAFENNQLTSITIPSSVNIIYQRAFKNNQLTNLTFENGVGLIYYEAFENNQLSSLTIPSSTYELGNACFKGNPLTNITSMRTTAPNINTNPTWDTFLGDRSGIDLTIPAGSMNSYVTGTNAKWTGFNSVTEDASLSTSSFEIEKDITIITNHNSIKIKSSDDLKIKKYSLYSLSGMSISTGKASSISTENISKGIYVLKLDFDKGTIIKKVLVY